MAENIPTSEPASFFAGDTLKFKILLSDYLPADGWTLKYAFTKSGQKYAFESIADGSYHLIEVAKATTADWDTGEYRFQAYVENDDGERYTVRTGQITIKQNLSAAVEDTGYDARSNNKKILDAIQSTILGTATKNQLSRKVGDRELRYMSPSMLAEWESIYESRVQAEEDADAVANGESVDNKLLVRFLSD